MSKVVIYAITRTKTGDRYIGSSINLRTRWKKHRYDLRKGHHHCTYLQRAWNAYGEKAFTFEILEEFESADDNERAAIELQFICTFATYNFMTSRTDIAPYPNWDTAKRDLASLSVREKMANSPEYSAFLAKRGEYLRNFMQSPEGRALAGAALKRRWKDPEERKKLQKGLINRWSDPTSKSRQKEKMHRSWTPERRAAHSAIIKTKWKSGKMVSGNISRWSDQEARKRQAEKMRAYHALKKATTQSRSE